MPSMSDAASCIQALASVCLVILTGLTLRVLRQYTTLTNTIADTGIKQAKIAAEQVENSRMPFVVLIAKPAEINRHGGGWAIENQGSGPALNIRHSDPRGNEGMFQTLRTFAVGDFQILNNYDVDVMRNHEFVIEYESISGIRYTTRVDWSDGPAWGHMLISYQ
jgi:hypothetical protein